MEGTVFHEIAERCLLGKGSPRDYLWDLIEVDEGEDGSHDELMFVQVDRAMVEHLEAGLSRIAEIVEELGPDTIVYVETRVNLEPWLGEGEFGTSDIIIVNVAKRVVICWDWKYGIGVPVFPTWNMQAILYCLGAWNTVVADLFDGDWKDIKVDIIIRQPRIPTAGGVWTTTMEELLEYGKQLPAQAAATLDPDAPRIPGEKQCRFCRARHACGARAKARLDDIRSDFEDLDAADMTGAPLVLPKVSDLTAAQASVIAMNSGDIIRWVKEVQAGVERALVAGHREGMAVKLVEGNRRPPRSWDAGKKGLVEKIVRKAVGDKAFKSTMLTPTQLQEQFPSVYEKVKEHVAQGRPKPILVPRHDPRDEIAGLIEEFEIYTGDDDE